MEKRKFMFWFNIAIVATLIIAAIIDLIKREIPDYLAYIMLALSIIYFIFFNTHTIMQILTVALFSFIGTLFYLLGLWSMGDTFAISSAALIVPNLIYFTLVTFSFSAIFMIFYILIFGALRKFFAINKLSILRAVVAVIISVLTYFFLDKLSIIMPSLLTILFFALFFPEIEQFQQKAYYIAKPDELVEGDWIIEPVVVKNKVLVPVRKIGLTKEDIEKIKRAKVNVKVKRGVPLILGLVIAPILYLI